MMARAIAGTRGIGGDGFAASSPFRCRVLCRSRLTRLRAFRSPFVILRYSEGSGTDRRIAQILREYAQDDKRATQCRHLLVPARRRARQQLLAAFAQLRGL